MIYTSQIDRNPRFQISNKSISFIVFTILFFISVLPAYAVAPSISGSVVTRSGAPIAGVWVRVEIPPCDPVYKRSADISNCPECIDVTHYRYEQTDRNGRFMFPPIQSRDCGLTPPKFVQIDTDLDGVTDTQQYPSAPKGCPDEICTYQYGCANTPYNFSVVKPAGDRGSFTSINNVYFSNADADLNIGKMYYDVNTNSPTPTPQDGSQTFNNEPPFPSCLAPSIIEFGGRDTELCRSDYGTCTRTKSYTFSSSGGLGVIKAYTGMGHRWDQDCNIGPNNDPGNDTSSGTGDCDDATQTFEAVKVRLNGAQIGQTTDLGTDVNSYWEFPASLLAGTNLLEFEHVIAGQNISSNSESVFIKGVVCDSGVPATVTPPPSVSCTLQLPPNISAQVSNIASVPLSINANNGDIDELTYTLSSSSIASVCSSALSSCLPGQSSYVDTNKNDGLSAQYQGFATGSVNLTVSGRMLDEGAVCTPATTSISFENVDAWWQVKEGDVNTNGNIDSKIPTSCTVLNGCDPSFIVHDANDYPGVATTGLSYGSGNVSSTGWLATNTQIVGMSQYDFEYFERKLRDIKVNSINTPTVDQSVLTSVVSPVEEDNYYYFFYDGSVGDLSIEGDVSFGGRNVVLFVENASLIVNGDIRVTPGLGFFMAIVERDIIVQTPGSNSGSQPHLEGLYFAKGSFESSTLGTGDEQLRVRGAISAGNISLNRNLSNNSFDPSEIIEYAPDQYMRYPLRLSQPRITWKEIDR